jgi:hypothetical protein
VETALRSPKSAAGNSALRNYFFGLGLVVAGAGLMDLTGSVIPLAFAGSAALMLTVPLVRRIATRKRPPQ